jgi:hypothetical protein
MTRGHSLCTSMLLGNRGFAPSFVGAEANQPRDAVPSSEALPDYH